MSSRSPFSPRLPAAGEEVLRVSELDARLRAAVQRLGRVIVEGEITGFRGPNPSGHLYFTLKDERAEATISCAMFKREAQLEGGSRVQNGARVRVHAQADVYAPRGALQILVSRVVAAGEGDLLQRREELKKKLGAEGLFDPARKRALPVDPRIVGVVTSGAGAVLHDIVTVAKRRGAVRILLAPSAVQGDDAPRQLRLALARLAQLPEVDVIILGRGGGSAEDLAAFDDEQLARAIAGCPKPVVAAVGHEVDWSIACLVADVRAATPSQAAELVVPDTRARLSRLGEGVRRLGLAMRARLRRDQAVLERSLGRLRAPERAIAARHQRLDDLRGRLADAMRGKLETSARSHQRLARSLAERHPRAVVARAHGDLSALSLRLSAAMRKRLARSRALLEGLSPRPGRAIRAVLVRRRGDLAEPAARLSAISPLAVLARGYAIALVRTASGLAAVTDVVHVRVGDSLKVRLSRGTLEAEVTGKRGDDDP